MLQHQLHYNDQGFGHAVAVSESASLVVVGKPSFNAGYGAVFAFDLSSGWEFDALFPLAQGDASFGRSVAVDGSRLAVGAPFPPNEGAVYWFVRNGWTWTLEDRDLLHNYYSDTGSSVALAGDTTWIGGNGTVALFGRQPALTGDCDSDLIPDSCQPDTDGDWLIDACDNCPSQVNTDQANHDADASGDACDTDDDDDSVVDTADCAPLDASAWTIPGEAFGLRVDSMTAVSWERLASPGAASATYDTLRSTQASNWSGSATCLETGGVDQRTIDGATPAPGGLFCYLVRGRNACGTGTIGADSRGVTRPARVCP
jgi:hypothetical protein